MSDSAQERALFQQWITSPSAGYCRRNPDGSRYEWPAKRTPEPTSTPGEGTLHGGCTLTDAEREAIEWCIFQQATPQRKAATLRGLLERSQTATQ